VWTLVEARRDGLPGHKRRSPSEAAVLIETELRESPETIEYSARQMRRLHAETEKMLDSGVSPDPRYTGTEFADICRSNLANIRAHREKVGWHLRIDWLAVLEASAGAFNHE
jgi:hypothetical protein